MPELPEVETVRRGLEQRTQGFAIARVQVHRPRAVASPDDPEAFAAALQGCTVQHWRRRGKYLISQLQRGDGRDGGHWGVHLRMTGQFLWLEAPRPSCAHTRVQLWNDQGQELRFVDTRSFGQMWWIPPGEPPEMVMGGLRHLGPEPLGPAFTASYLEGRLNGSSRPIKNALLDQAVVAGVGNIYADESLFAAGIRPHTPAGQLRPHQLDRLVKALVEVLEISIGAGGTTFSDFRDLTGTNGNYGGVALVYRRGGEPCRRCGTPIQRHKLAGRSSHWCPNCQH
ncbi:formamidopyrimidine-DNA glycosylase [Cyanobium sp. PCC 7001]|uniref:DNA-formamidopyrimidine glycosylase n=1 Tax=Cyanobium sp. PCC 7001 TaxID=180281 RepID=UPI00018052DB|nr:DNA-formamidopyrimidine glycosylase [Cyanobium sp. PCC 7001]EDY37794.1 formamidopyrimidine-DNA glycosylase [Cyanobium sp. PCC 7001]